MDLQALQAALASGTITQEHYDAEVAKINAEKKEEKTPDNNFDFNTLLQNDDFKNFIEKQMQSSNDKIRTEYSKKITDIQSKYDELKTEKMTDEEKLQLKEQQLREQSEAFEKQKLEFEFVNYLSSEKLPAALNNFVPGTSLEKKQENLRGLLDIMNGFVEEKVKERFGSQSHDFKEGETKKYNWAEMSIDEKIKLAESNPELYQKLKTS